MVANDLLPHHLVAPKFNLSPPLIREGTPTVRWKERPIVEARRSGTGEDIGGPSKLLLDKGTGRLQSSCQTYRGR